jgi:Mg-chelatase subunit ChlD
MAKEAKKNLNQTEIVVVLDRSGSMGSIAPATVEGFNKFLLEQQNSEGDAYITLIQFDDRYELNYKSVPVKEAAPLILGESFKPRGGTALLDAVGKTIEELKTDRDVVFVIITDGEENQSRTYKREAINKMIETQTDEEGWKFLFLAANQDAIRTGSSIGIKGGNSITYSATSDGATNVFASVSMNMSKYRSSKADLFSKSFSSGELNLDSIEKDLDFNDKQRKDSK